MRANEYLGFLLTPVLMFLVSCGGGTSPVLNDEDVNLIFVVSPDLAYQGAGDVDTNTANLTPQGLQRSLLMARYLKDEVLEGRNVTIVTALEPMTHLQTENNYPDMTAIGYIQQFALLNKITLQDTPANSYPIGTSYGARSVPPSVAEPSTFIADCQGLAFSDEGGDNLALAKRLIDAKHPGFYVFSAPWETTSALLRSINEAKGYDLSLPAEYQGPNYVYAISVSAQEAAKLTTFDSKLNPPTEYPRLPVKEALCNQQEPLNVERRAGTAGVRVPWNSNVSETVYLMRHAEAHPAGNNWDDGNFVGTGQWRALALAEALRGKINPDQVYSIDPAQAFDVGHFALFSYIRPSLTVLPYVIANNLPYNLAANFPLGSANDLNAATATREFFFTGGRFSNQTILVAWEHAHFPPLVTSLLQSYGGSDELPSLNWPDTDYDTIWTVRLDQHGNLSIDNALCEGIDTSGLPGEPPQF